MAIDLKKNKDSLTKAINAVVDVKSDTDWVIFGYEGQTCTLKVVETGGGGLDEMIDDLNSSKIMYGYCRVKDPNTDLFKYVLINWQGEGAPDQFRLKYSTHLNDIKSLCRSIHVTINARTEDDVDIDIITTKVAKSSGSNYSFHKEKARPVEEPTPVGTNYKRTVATRDINNKSRDKFWAGTEKDEAARIEEEKKRKNEEASKMDAERKDREEREQKEIEMNDEQRRQSQNMARKERTSEAAHLVGGKTSGTRSMFEEKSRQVQGAGNTGPPPPRKLKSTFLENQSSQEEPARKQPIQLPRSNPPAAPTREPEPEQSYEPEPEQQSYEPEEQSYEPEPEPEQQSYEPERSYEPEPVSNPVPTGLPKTRNLLAEGLPKRQDSDDEETEEQEWEDEPQETVSAASPPASSQPTYVVEEDDIQTPTDNGGVSTGLTATALYDYQATDETEITFDPGDMILNIEQIDEGWWLGTGPDGNHGMFPANYVELNE
ncbi:drebrin-like protein A isoform X2 [Patella vulgata]|uniref:drebrin-like protein A isoform X2 n=1 Tax=Patella vulgata TaxID=6465 RepID=UPI0021802C96|nr:drebrin-like protein A isoform X2 [Patella vulgata]